MSYTRKPFVCFVVVKQNQIKTLIAKHEHMEEVAILLVQPWKKSGIYVHLDFCQEQAFLLN